jgi:hypothetical protein
MSTLVVRGLFRRLICTKVCISKAPFVNIISGFRLHLSHPLHEIDLDVHGANLQVGPFIILAMSVPRIGLQGFCSHSVSGCLMKTTINATQRSGYIYNGIVAQWPL